MANITIAGFPPQATLDKEDIIHVSRNGVDYRSTVGAASKDLPVGFIYTQLPNKQSPSELGLVGTWANISSAFAGNFFRVEGGDSSIFESGTQSHQLQGHRHARQLFTTVGGTVSGIAGIPLESTGYTVKNGGVLTVGDPVADTTSGEPITGSETRSINETIRIWERTA